MKRYVIMYEDGQFAGSASRGDSPVVFLGDARLFGNVACAKNSKVWKRATDAEVVDVCVIDSVFDYIDLPEENR